LFTSFGYFRDDAQHLRVISEVTPVTRLAGWFVLDYLPAEHVRRTLVPYDARAVGRVTVEQERLFEPDELAALCTSARK
jgi:hypothetical protein